MRLLLFLELSGKNRNHQHVKQVSLKGTPVASEALPGDARSLFFARKTGIGQHRLFCGRHPSQCFCNFYFSAILNFCKNGQTVWEAARNPGSSKSAFKSIVFSASARARFRGLFALEMLPGTPKKVRSASGHTYY